MCTGCCSRRKISSFDYKIKFNRGMEGSLLKLPDFFPKVSKDCAIPGNKFMACFTNSSSKKNTDDSEAGSRGLQICARELLAYELCMKNSEGKQAPKRYRVQEEYKVR